MRERISKYELGKPKSYKLKEDDLNNHLTSSILEKDATRELSLEEILSRLKFDANQVFQHVERLLEKHGAAGLFPDKKISKIIVASVQPKELRRRVEYELATVVGKRKMDKLPIYIHCWWGNINFGMNCSQMEGSPPTQQRQLILKMR